MSMVVELRSMEEENRGLFSVEEERPAGCTTRQRVEAVVFPALILASAAVTYGGFKLMEITAKSSSLLNFGLSIVVLELGFLGTVGFGLCGLKRCSGEL